METQGGLSDLRRIEVTVLRAHNLPRGIRWLRVKRKFFVTVSHDTTTMKSASVKIVGQTVRWNEKLEPFFVSPSSRLTLRLFAKRFLHRDILVGTQEIILPRYTRDLSFNLSNGNNGQAEQATRPVMIHLTVTVPVNARSSSLPSNPPSHVVAVPGSTQGYPTSPTGPTAVEVSRSPPERAARPIARAPDWDTAPPTWPQPTVIDRSPVAGPSRSPPVDVRIEALPTRHARHHSNEATKPVNTTRRREESTDVHTGPLHIPEFEPTIDDIIQTVSRFRILSIGRSGVGKSSLINCVFGINAAQVANYRPGEANIQQEFVSPENGFFVLHDSKGFEPGDLSNFETVRDFVQQRSRHELPLSERVHGLWLCTETPTAGGRIFETGDERLLQFAHKNQVPIVVVFTQYDRLVRTKEAELREEYPHMDPKRLRDLSAEEAHTAYTICLQSLQRISNRLRIPMPHYAKASVRPGHQEDVSDLVRVTRDIVKERLKGDAWVLWAIAQRASLPVKIDACITKGLSHYRRALAACAPGVGQQYLRHCLGKVHKDIITCWNFKGEDLNSPKFRHLMLCLVQDVYTKPGLASPPVVDVIGQYVTLLTAAAAPIAPPVAILGLTYTFVQWLSKTALENASSVHQLLIAYTVDLIRVLRELFDITLRPELALATTWTELKEALEAYERSNSRQRIHGIILSRAMEDEPNLTPDSIGIKVRELLRD